MIDPEISQWFLDISSVITSFAGIVVVSYLITSKIYDWWKHHRQMEV